MCTKYTNDCGTTFIKCDKVNKGKYYNPSYLMIVTEYDCEPENINFCPNCGNKLGVINNAKTINSKN